jgi:TM2 domain-containing membrane protein YozV
MSLMQHVPCPGCGHPHDPDDRFCVHCGHALEQHAAPAAPPSDGDLEVHLKPRAAVAVPPPPAGYAGQVKPPPPPPVVSAPAVAPPPPVAAPHPGLSREAIVLTQRKSTGLAVFLSFLLPGIGQFYAGATGKGIMFIVLDVLNVLLALVLIGFFTGFICWIWSMVDANASANTYNTKLLMAAAT